MFQKAIAAGNLALVVETVEIAQGGQTVIDGLGGGLGVLVKLVTDIIEEGGFVQLGEGSRRGLRPPASEVQQVIAIGAYGARRKPTDMLQVEKLIHPSDVTTLPIEEAIRRCTGTSRLLEGEMEVGSCFHKCNS